MSTRWSTLWRSPSDRVGRRVRLSTAVISTRADNHAGRTPANPLQGQEGALYSGPIGTLADADPGGQVNDYTVSVNWGDGSPTTSATLTPNGGGTFTISGSHLYAEDGVYNITYLATDTDQHLTSTPAVPRSTTTGTLASRSDAAQTGADGRRRTRLKGNRLPTSWASFRDLDPGGQLGDYTATINGATGPPCRRHDRQ